MIQRNLNRLNMWKAVYLILMQNQSIWKDNVEFSASVNRLKQLIDEGDEAAGLTDSTGVTQDRKALADTAIEKVLQVSNLARAFARKKERFTLLNELQFAKGYLRYLPGDELVPRLQSMLSAALSVKGDLAPFGFVAQMETDASAALSAYQAVEQGTRNVIASNASTSRNMILVNREARGELYNLDDMIGQYKSVAALFVSAYFQSRVIVDAGIRHEGDSNQNTAAPAMPDNGNTSAA